MTIQDVAMLEVPVETAPEQEHIKLRGRIEAHVEFELDITAMRNAMEKAKPGSWADYSLELGYQEWERASVISWDHLVDALDLDMYSPHAKVVWSDVDDIHWQTKWTPELAEQLNLFPKESAATVDAAENSSIVLLPATEPTGQNYTTDDYDEPSLWELGMFSPEDLY